MSMQELTPQEVNQVAGGLTIEGNGVYVQVDLNPVEILQPTIALVDAVLEGVTHILGSVLGLVGGLLGAVRGLFG